MKKTFVLIAALFCIMLLSVNPASAWYLELDNTDGDNEIDVWFRMDNGESAVDLTKYDIGFYYDATELEYSSYTNNLPDGWTEKYTPEEYNSGNGVTMMYGIYGSGDPGSFSLSGDYLLGSYIMTVRNGAEKDGINDLWFPESLNVDDVMISIHIGDMNTFEQYNTGSLINENKLINGSGLDLGSPVPVPGAVWLLGSGLVGLVGLHRKAHK